MNEKRFIRNIVGQIYDTKNDKFFEEDYVGKPIGYEDDVVEKMNALYEENVELLNFKDKVFNSLDGKIKRGEEAIEWGKSVDADVGAMGFHIEMLKRLKKELFEND